MSGGNFPFTPVPSSIRRKTISCLNICITTVLVKPDIDVLNKLKISDLLCVEVGDDEIYVTYGKEIAGYVEVVSDEDILQKLSDCIDSGTVYMAEIIELDIAQGICRVKIQAKRA